MTCPCAFLKCILQAMRLGMTFRGESSATAAPCAIRADTFAHCLSASTSFEARHATAAWGHAIILGGHKMTARGQSIIARPLQSFHGPLQPSLGLAESFHGPNEPLLGPTQRFFRPKQSLIGPNKSFIGLHQPLQGAKNQHFSLIHPFFGRKRTPGTHRISFSLRSLRSFAAIPTTPNP